jgi:hypothetical protein
LFGPLFGGLLPVRAANGGIDLAQQYRQQETPRDELGVVAVLGDTPLVAGDQRSHVLRAAFDVFGDVEFGDRHHVRVLPKGTQHAGAFVGRDGLE